MLPEICGSSFILSLPDDVFSIIARSLSPRDICNLSLCCRSLCALVASEKVWVTQCDMVGIVPYRDLIEWRKGVSSYWALCRFLVSVKPLMGIWVHQNPELGCRIIPQELGPLGIEDGPILWAPVFEIIGYPDGSTTFFLHGRDEANDYVYPGLVKYVERDCNVLLLEVEPRQHKSGSKLSHSKSFTYNSDKEMLIKVSKLNGGLSRSERVLRQFEDKVPFSRLAFSDRRKLIEVVTSHIGQKVLDSANGPLFPRSSPDEESFYEDIDILSERRSLLLHIAKIDRGHFDWKAASEHSTQLSLSEIRKSIDYLSVLQSSVNVGDNVRPSITKKNLSGYFRATIKQILGKSPFLGRRAHPKAGSSCCENKHAQLHEFLRSGDSIGLTLLASTVKLSSYRAWPNMHDSRFALYKLPLKVPKPDEEYAGLWGGTFGWPPGKPTEDKPGKALFFLLISYEESEGQRLLIATKILEGTHYVLHPNGSAMFIANIDEPSHDPFPWEVDADVVPVNVKHAFTGEGIANGYGFRYPGSKPGSLYVIQNGLLAFIWKESQAVLTMQRLNLHELLKKGERVPALLPIANFSYLIKSYSNVFAGISNNATCLS